MRGRCLLYKIRVLNKYWNHQCLGEKTIQSVMWFFSHLVGAFGINAKEPVQSWIVRCIVVIALVVWTVLLKYCTHEILSQYVPWTYGIHVYLSLMPFWLIIEPPCEFKIDMHLY